MVPPFLRLIPRLVVHLVGGIRVALEAFGHKHLAVRKAGSPAAPFQSQARLLPAQGPEGRIFEALLLVLSRSVCLALASIALGSEMETSLDCVPPCRPIPDSQPDRDTRNISLVMTFLWPKRRQKNRHCYCLLTTFEQNVSPSTLLLLPRALCLR